VTDCVFCRIVTGDAPSEIVAQNERALAVMDINPATDGHTLVISKAHAADIWELRPEDGEAVWSLTSDVAVAIRDSLHPDGLTLFQANRKAGWQDVFHFHLHVVPRRPNDDFVRPWQSSSARRDGIGEAAAKIRSELGSR
jgi:histidine triad (HIT) family protein